MSVCVSECESVRVPCCQQTWDEKEVGGVVHWTLDTTGLSNGWIDR